jgi:hypothetical protein
MFKLLFEFSFAKWFFTEASKDDARHEFDTFKFLHVDKFVNDLIKKGSTDPNFLTSEQRSQLEQILNTDLLFDDLDSFKRTQFSRMGKNPITNLDKNIAKKLSEFPLDSYANLSDMIEDVNNKKTGTMVVNDPKSLVNYLLVNRALSGESSAKNTEIEGAQALLQRQKQSAEQAKRKSATQGSSARNPIESTLVNCARAALQQKMEKIKKSMEGNIRLILSDISTPDQDLSLNDIVHARAQSLAYLLLEFLTGTYEKENIAGQMQKHDHFNDNDLLGVLKSGQRHITKILESPSFQAFKEKILSGQDKNQAVQVLILTSVLGSLLYGLQSGNPVGAVKEIHKQNPLVRNNDQIKDLIDSVADKFLVNQTRMPPKLTKQSARKTDLTPSMQSGDTEILQQKVFDQYFPNESVMLEVQEILSPLFKISNILYAMRETDSKKRTEKIKQALNFGTENSPAYLDIEDLMKADEIDNECEQILTALKKAGAI